MTNNILLAITSLAIAAVGVTNRIGIDRRQPPAASTYDRFIVAIILIVGAILFALPEAH